MKFFFALLALVAAASARPNTKGLQDRIVLYPHLMNPGGKVGSQPISRIVGGTEATPHSYPFIVALNIDGLYFCGGSIISETVILTAAHCLDNAGFVVVTAGAHDQSTNEPTQQTFTTRNLVVHEKWSSFNLENDIALATLEEGDSLKFDKNIAAITLAAREPEVGETVTAAGWGKTCDGFGCGVSDTLNEVDVPVGDDSAAEGYYGIGCGTKICIDASNGMGTCNGDSGGPLIDNAGKLIGATSFGASAGCESGKPDCFTSIPCYLDWIGKNANIQGLDAPPADQCVFD